MTTAVDYSCILEHLKCLAHPFCIDNKSKFFFCGEGPRLGRLGVQVSYCRIMNPCPGEITKKLVLAFLYGKNMGIFLVTRDKEKKMEENSYGEETPLE